jgi:heptaprenyl diphosphate synthase
MVRDIQAANMKEKINNSPLFQKLRQFRLWRSNIYNNIFSAEILFAAGLLIMPAFLFNHDTQLRAVQFLFFWFLAWLSGKKINPLVTIAVMAVITACNLLVPYGQVLFSIAQFKITSGALKTGVHRAVTLQGLFMLSRFTIRPDLKIPGAFGGVFGESLRLFTILNGRKPQFNRKDILGSIDRLMLELGDPQIAVGTPAAKSAAKPAGFLFLAVTAFLSWLPFFLQYFTVK